VHGGIIQEKLNRFFSLKKDKIGDFAVIIFFEYIDIISAIFFLHILHVAQK
jgi:hypothetical protein